MPKKPRSSRVYSNRDESIPDKLFKYFQANPQEVIDIKKMIREFPKENPGTIAAAMTRLANRNYITRIEHGYYQLAIHKPAETKQDKILRIKNELAEIYDTTPDKIVITVTV
jgi:predicted transcriptional regulator of viral defense system